jgi:CheY-like chemotaxis protein
LQALRAGYNAHIAKPIDIAKLMATVASLVPR